MGVTIDGYTWFSAVCSGAQYVIAQQKKLNQINVFPVADGDTGSNLSALMRSILQHASPDKSFYKTAHSIAQASLTGARGNSGTIFAQFFQGFIPHFEKTELSSQELAEQIEKAANTAKEAVMEPVLGTILTVMADWGNACQELKQKVKNYSELFQTSLAHAQDSLESTKKYLEVLRKANVVDAGAQGFVYFLEGICQYFNNPTQNFTFLQEETLQFDNDIEEHHFVDTEPTFRYCTELLITEISEEKMLNLKQELANFGDSIVLAGSKEKCKIHLHTNDPANLIKKMENCGKIQYQKAEDMLRQYQMTQQKTASIALVMDSSADVPKEFIDEHQIHVVPFTVQVENREYLDRLTIENETIYKQMRSGNIRVTTALPNPSLVENMFKTLKPHYQKVIAITIASVQSGTHQLFNKMGENSGIPQVKVIDSKRNSMAHGLLVHLAARLIQENKSFEEIVAKIEQARTCVNVYAALHNVKYMMRSGRISKGKTFLSNLLSLKALISLDPVTGKGIIWKKTFGFKNAIESLLNLAKTQKNQIEAYVVSHADDLEGAKKFAQELEKIIGFPPLYLIPVSASVGVHVGPGTIGMATLLKRN